MSAFKCLVSLLTSLAVVEESGKVWVVLVDHTGPKSIPFVDFLGSSNLQRNSTAFFAYSNSSSFEIFAFIIVHSIGHYEDQLVQ